MTDLLLPVLVCLCKGRTAPSIKSRVANKDRKEGHGQRVTDFSFVQLRDTARWVTEGHTKGNKKLSYRRVTAQCVVSVEILPTAMQQRRNYLYDKS